MPFNPSKAGEPLSAPTNGRSNTVNDPGYENKVGYYPYDLSHTEILTPLFGHITPSMHLITNMGDRHVIHDDAKIILNRINGNFLNKINQYTDHFFVSNRTLFPNNWDKLIPNPVKGDDLPNSARPVVPLYAYFDAFLNEQIEFSVEYDDGNGGTDFDLSNYVAIRSISDGFFASQLTNAVDNEDFPALVTMSYGLADLLFLSYMVSRGQLLDYLGVQFDERITPSYLRSLQYKIDRFIDDFARFCIRGKVPCYTYELDPTKDVLNFTQFLSIQREYDMSTFRDRFMTAFERGHLFVPWFFNLEYSLLINEDEDSDEDILGDLTRSIYNLVSSLQFLTARPRTIVDVDADVEFNADGKFINISKCLAYQLCVAQYYTNDSVDNIFTSELYMQLLRGVMFPSINNLSTEPTFDFNGVPTEYDYISYGGFYRSLLDNSIGGANARRFIFGSLMFLIRRSLRYGDYFTTGRTRMLAIGQLSVPVTTEENSQTMSVNPVDMTLGLVSQRYFNAVNRVGNKPLAYYASIMGVTPSDLPSIPRYIGHRKIELGNQITNNTAEEQGKQSTNLVGFSDDKAMDVFIDDYGIILSLVSYDVLPIYNSGIDADNFLSDRFEYFNPMMQNIGDQPIRLSELIGYPNLYEKTFAYTVRNKEYKYKLSKAHGTACYNLPGFILKFPTYQYDEYNLVYDPLEKIDPDFIRDKPSNIDSIISHNTGASPGEYFHFIVSMHNSVKSARLIQRAPGILF